MLATPSPIPFDFLVDGSFLRTSIEDYLKARGLSSESALTVQYVRSLVPPVYQASFQHDDWVSAVDVLSASSRAGLWSGDRFATGQDRLLTASYDGLLRVWNDAGSVVATSPAAGSGHSVKAARFLSASQVASAGLDRVVRVWKYAEADDFLSGTLKPSLELYGHGAAVEALDVHGPTGRVLSAAADGSVALWTTSKSAAPPAPANLLPGAPATGASNKRRKVAASSAAQRGPLSLMQPHTSAASAVVFDPADATVAYTASQDHTIRTLDLTTGRVENVITTSHPLLSLCAIQRSSSSSSVLLAAGTSARHITIADPRAGAATTSVMTLRGHRNMVGSVAAAPDSDYGLVSGSHDGTCRVWDLRSVRAATRAEGGGSVSESVYVIERESRKGNNNGNNTKSDVPGRGAKVFSVAWDKTWGIVSAGEDKQVQINRGRDLLAA